MIDATRQRKPLGDINDVFQALQCRPQKIAAVGTAQLP
jgi:hypothetical protein